MAYAVKSTQQWFDLFLANYELYLTQSSPLNDRSFLEVTCMNMAAMATSMQKYASFQAKQNLALSASGDYLNKLAEENGVTVQSATNTALTATAVTTTDGISIPLSREYTADSTGIKYSVTASSVSVGNSLTLSLLCQTSGTAGNLTAGDTLTISSQVAGASSTATVSAVSVTGTEAETEDSIRQNTLFAERAQTGGGNLADYRIWGNRVEGVEQIYPFTGPPLDSGYDIEPPWRTVFVEATTDIDPDGIPTTGLLEQVKAAIQYKEDGVTRQENAGNTDEYLLVEAITRTDIYVTVYDLEIASELEAETKSKISSAVTLFLLSIIPYISGVDPTIDKNNRLTQPYLNEIVNNVVRSQGGSITNVTFGLTSGTVESEYEVTQSNLIKLVSTGIVYA